MDEYRTDLLLIGNPDLKLINGGGYGFKKLPNVLMLMMYYLNSKSRDAPASFSRKGTITKIISNKLRLKE